MTLVLRIPEAAISMLAYRGDLGLDNGVPQSVYALQKKNLEPIKKADGKQVRIDLAMGATATLPDGLGTVTFDGLSRYVKLQVSLPARSIDTIDVPLRNRAQGWRGSFTFPFPGTWRLTLTVEGVTASSTPVAAS